jgi:hypothetical protein
MDLTPGRRTGHLSCHSERSEESQIQFWTAPQGNRPEMFRSAQHDSVVLKRALPRIVAA